MSKSTTYPKACICNESFISHRSKNKVILYCPSCGNEARYDDPKKEDSAASTKDKSSVLEILRKQAESQQPEQKKKAKKKQKGRNTPSHAKGYINSPSN